MEEVRTPDRHVHDAASFRRRAAEALLGAPCETAPGPETLSRYRASDFDLDPAAFWEFAGEGEPRAASVLVPIVERAELMVLMTLRTAHLPSHAGQISFPGGKAEAGDATPLDTALREAHEEIGLDRRFVEPLGFLDCYRTGTGYRITPAVAAVSPGFTLSPDPHEVAEVFEVPLAFLFDAANHQLHARVLAGRERRFHAIPFGERFIWGATAGIIKNMHARFLGA